MKREIAEKWMLLDEAGELGGLRRWRLHRALARQPELRAWRTDMAILREETRRAADPIPATPRDVMAAILQAGERSRAASPSVMVFHPAWAGAAVLVLSLAAWMTLVNPAAQQGRQGTGAGNAASAIALSWEDGLDNQLADLDAKLDAHRESWGEAAGMADELDAMASELLDEGAHI